MPPASVHVDFDEESVGRGGAGFAWPQHSGLEEQPLHLPKHSPGSHTSDSDEESVHDRDRDHAESVDHEVSCDHSVEMSRIVLAWDMIFCLTSYLNVQLDGGCVLSRYVMS